MRIFAKTTSVVLILVLYSIIIHYTSCMQSKRSLAFTSGSSFGYIAAVAVPLELPHKNVFVAFNLETNYGLPPNSTHNDLINKWNLTGMFSNVNNDVTHIDGGRKRRSLYTRTLFYHTFMEYMNHFGFNGTGCLLRTICEVAESDLHISNGVLGSIFNILFTPSSSADENISILAYEAQQSGHQNDCEQFKKTCTEGFLDKVSSML